MENKITIGISVDNVVRSALAWSAFNASVGACGRVIDEDIRDAMGELVRSVTSRIILDLYPLVSDCSDGESDIILLELTADTELTAGQQCALRREIESLVLGTIITAVIDRPAYEGRVADSVAAIRRLCRGNLAAVRRPAWY